MSNEEMPMVKGKLIALLTIIFVVLIFSEPKAGVLLGKQNVSFSYGYMDVNEDILPVDLETNIMAQGSMSVPLVSYVDIGFSTQYNYFKGEIQTNQGVSTYRNTNYFFKFGPVLHILPEQSIDPFVGLELVYGSLDEEYDDIHNISYDYGYSLKSGIEFRFSPNLALTPTYISQELFDDRTEEISLALDIWLTRNLGIHAQVNHNLDSEFNFYFIGINAGR